MAAPLSVCTKKEQRSVIRFLWSEGVTGAAIHQRLSAQYGNSVLPQWSVYEWFEKLKSGRTSVTHEEGAGRPSTTTNKDNIERAGLRGSAKACNLNKRRGLLSKGVVLLHDDARPHTAAHTAETLRKLKSDVMAHPSYSPDLAPSDYHLFGPLKEALRGRRFTSDQEVKEAVHAWLAAQLKTFFSESIRNLVQRWTKCVEKQGDYAEK
ncbi:uncharacterized protein LOC111868870 [Cryptotermes secundus]|uniref:uncharacterized protein LOC111868870 n=1 Tax=Cryptotermes secundus TaxID=105785 RepID=UPI000CD7BC99|nr:uncharacterized protein LOC111868870 [Cryptotermes secundus]